jgi:hypothetical protein
MSWRRRQRDQGQEKAAPGPVCQCGHGWCFHYAHTHACAQTYCRCVRYCGPEPVVTTIEASQELIDWARKKVSGDG